MDIEQLGIARKVFSGLTVNYKHRPGGSNRINGTNTPASDAHYEN